VFSSCFYFMVGFLRLDPFLFQFVPHCMTVHMWIKVLPVFSFPPSFLSSVTLKLSDFHGSGTMMDGVQDGISAL
jgi:hypothetical protein